MLEVDPCVYIVESRRVMEQRDVKLNMQQTQSDSCEIPDSLKDRWMLVDRPRERLRIRGNVSMIVKYGKTKHHYTCLESKGHTFLLAYVNAHYIYPVFTTIYKECGISGFCWASLILPRIQNSFLADTILVSNSVMYWKSTFKCVFELTSLLDKISEKF